MGQQLTRTWGHVFLALLLVLVGLMTCVPEANAQRPRASIGGPNGTRVFPANAFRGVITMEKYPFVIIDGKQERLSVSARFFDTQNKGVLPGMLQGKRMVVNYVRSANGDLNTIWLLSPQEARQPIRLENPSWWARLKNTAEPLVDLAKWLALEAML